jgi:tellurite resistance protein
LVIKTSWYFEFVQGRLDARQGLHRMLQHVAADFEDALDDRSRRLAVADLDGGFDHREDEALDAVAVELQVPRLHRIKPRHRLLRLAIGR